MVLLISRLLKLFIAIVFYAGLRIFLFQQSLFRGNIRPMLVIITYHPIKASQTTGFKKQMDMLKSIGQPVPLTEIADLKSAYNIAVTFDDAYQSVLQNALPILKLNKIPATIFVPTGFLGKKPEWIKNPEHPYSNEIVATAEQLKSLPADFITIGSHTVSHLNLINIAEEVAKQEIFDSREALEKLLHRGITLFAAPYATLDEGFIDFFKQAGYERVFLNIPTFPATKTDLYFLGRTSVEPTDWPIEYYLKLTGAYQWMPLAIRIKKKLLG